MNRMTMDGALTRCLDEIAEPVVVCDDTGRTLGHFVPTVSAGARDKCPYSVEELEQMCAALGGRTIGEIWKWLATK